MFNKIKRFIDKKIIQHKFSKNGGSLKKPLSLVGHEFFAVGNNVRIKSFSTIECFRFFGSNNHSPKVIIEDNVIIGPFLTMLVTDTLTIGKNTIIAHNSTITTENHGINPELDEPYAAQNLSSKPISIGSNCWIGSNVTILPGVVLGNNCVVAANSVVNKSFPDNSMIAGVPARVVKIYNFKEHVWMRVDE